MRAPDIPWVSELPTYRGPFTREQAERLLWRAGFGPRKGEAEKLAKLGVRRAVTSLTRPDTTRLVGPAPKDEKGRRLAPLDAWGHDGLWWLDRMVRTRAPLVERMALVWHDWFATSNDGVGSPRLMLRQNRLFRERGLGSFRRLLLEITCDPAMLLWLSGSDNNRWSPNENYARELMELFTLGHGHGYTEEDVRQQARALTGFRNDWSRSSGPIRFRYDPKYHDGGVKRVFGKRGRFTWRDSCRLCLEHPAHPAFFVTKLPSYLRDPWEYNFSKLGSRSRTLRSISPESRISIQLRPVSTASRATVHSGRLWARASVSPASWACEIGRAHV